MSRFLLPLFSTETLVLACAIATGACLGSAPVQAAPAATPKFPLASSTSIASGDKYILGSEDVLSVAVLKHPAFSANSLVIPSSGSIVLPVVGSIVASGRTLAQLDAEITRRLRSRLLRPEVVVSLVKPRPRPIYVVGAVRAPGVYEHKDGWRVTQALAAAGGLSVGSERVAVLVTRGRTKIVDGSLAPILNDPSSVRNVVVQVRDVVRFYEQVVNVQVTGAVAKPGAYAVPEGGGVVEAIGMAGGATPDASLSRASLRRNGAETPVDLFAALRQGIAKENVPLVDGDVLIVPQLQNRVSVLGLVKNPGFYGVEDGRVTTLADVIALAGGPLPGAALTRAVLRRDNSETTIDLYKILMQGEKASNVPVRADDVITVPEARGVTVLGEVSKPGSYKLEAGGNPRIADAIAAAGGLSIKPEGARISLARNLPNDKMVSMRVDPVGLLELSDLSQNGRVLDGDIISVSAVKKVIVLISGEVKTPGAYVLEETDSVPELIARAGGPTEEAALSQVSVTSGGNERQIVDVVSALREGAGKVSIALAEGALVVVPRNKNRILVVGAVSKPGSYPLAEDRVQTLGDVLSLAGGPQNNARVKQVSLLRQGTNGPVRRDLRIDRPERNSLGVNEPILAGDVVYVNEGRPSQNTMDYIGRFLPSAALLLR